MRSTAGLFLVASGLVISHPAAHASQLASRGSTSAHVSVPPAISSPGEAWQSGQGVLYLAVTENAPLAFNLPVERLRPLAPNTGPSILKTTPKVGPFKLTFYSDVPVTGFDGMYKADVVISLTRKF